MNMASYTINIMDAIYPPPPTYLPVRAHQTHSKYTPPRFPQPPSPPHSPLYIWKPVLGDNIVENSVGRGFGAPPTAKKKWKTAPNRMTWVGECPAINPPESGTRAAFQKGCRERGSAPVYPANSLTKQTPGRRTHGQVIHHFPSRLREQPIEDARLIITTPVKYRSKFQDLEWWSTSLVAGAPSCFISNFATESSLDCQKMILIVRKQP